MKKLSIAGIFRGSLFVSLVLATPGVSWANNHILGINGATVGQQAIVTDAGQIVLPLILNSFDSPPQNVTLGQGQSLTTVRNFVKLCKPGTKGQLEWLDQGNAVVGFNGVLTGSVTGPPQRNYRLTLTTTVVSDTYASSTGSCSPIGQSTLTLTRGAVVERQSGASGNFSTILTTTYNFGSVSGGRLPEPATVLLMATALLALAWFSRRRTRTPQRVPD